MARNAPQVSIEVIGLDPLIRRLKTAGTRGEITINELLRKIGQHVTPILRKFTPRDTGKLANSTVFQVLRRGGEQFLEFRQGAKTPEGEFYGPFVREGTAPHVIRPKRPDGVLRFIPAGSGTVVFTREVHHPGTKPNPYHRRALTAANNGIQELLRQTGEQLARFIAGRGTPP